MGGAATEAANGTTRNFALLHDALHVSYPTLLYLTEPIPTLPDTKPARTALPLAEVPK